LDVEDVRKPTQTASLLPNLLRYSRRSARSVARPSHGVDEWLLAREGLAAIGQRAPAWSTEVSRSGTFHWKGPLTDYVRLLGRPPVSR